MAASTESDVTLLCHFMHLTKCGTTQAKLAEDPFARTPSLSEELEELLNHGIAFHLTAANAADSAAAFFGM